MPKERTEEQILTGEPLKLRFAGKDYDVPVLSRSKARVWREKLIATAKEISELGVSVDGLGTAISVFPDKQAELVCLYAPSVPCAEIMENATEEEIVIAFSSISSVSFPFLRQLSMLKATAMATLLPSEKSSSLSSANTASRRVM
jgi:hypothetical protein